MTQIKLNNIEVTTSLGNRLKAVEVYSIDDNGVANSVAFTLSQSTELWQHIRGLLGDENYQ